MSVSVDDLRSYINAPDSDDEFLAQCLDTSYELLASYLDGNIAPPAVFDQAHLIAASDTYMRRSSPQGLSQFASTGEAPIRVPKDVLNGVYPLLQQYVEVGL